MILITLITFKIYLEVLTQILIRFNLEKNSVKEI